MASQLIRWLHLSDFHVGKDDYAQRKIFEQILQHVGERKKQGQVPDLIFITGDLADKGMSDQFSQFTEQFLVPLQDLLGDGIEQRTFAVPGNHDVDITTHQAFDRGEICDAKSRYFDPTEEGRKLREMLVPRLRAYQDQDFTVPLGTWISSVPGTFWNVKEVRGLKLGVVGINTAWLCKGEKDDKDRHRLTPGKPLVEEALSHIKDCNLCLILGHHPLDWWLDSELPALRALFGKHQAVYLHGHLHKSRVSLQDGSGKQFLSVQCGAAFQARETEPWRNGILWAEADLDQQVLRLQPLEWVADNQEWAITTGAFPEARRPEGSDWWIYPLPGTEAPATTGTNSSTSRHGLKLPDGWHQVTMEELAQYSGALDSDSAIRFFDGAVPNWRIAVSSSIPRRAIVAELAGYFLSTEKLDRPRVVLLLGAGGEGKTTALLQTIHAILQVSPQWRVLHRADETRDFLPEEFLPLISTPGPWLLVTDEADGIAAKIHEMTHRLQRLGRNDVHFLIGCRDTDWIAAKANNLSWDSSAVFHQNNLRGLKQTEAREIIAAWSRHGPKGLGRLSSVSETEAVRQLVEAATREAQTAEGAFFGAMLTARFGNDLLGHVHTLLGRLGERSIQGGGTLRDALGYIAAMHAEGFGFLSRPVLARVLGCPLNKLKRHVLAPLGEEAAAATTSQFVFTRHRRIAQAIVEVLASEFNEDIDELYIALSAAAIEASTAGEFVPELAGWRYTIPDHFAEKQLALAIRVARAVFDREPDNQKTLVKLSEMYRRAGAPEQAVKLFRQFGVRVGEDRVFYYEWGVAEGGVGNVAANVLLATYSIADTCSTIPPSNSNAAYCFAGLDYPFRALYDSCHEMVFLEGRASVAVLGQQLVLDGTGVEPEYLGRHLEESVRQGAKVPSVSKAFQLLRAAAVAAAGRIAKSSLANSIPAPQVMTFHGLERLVENAIRRKALQNR
jgi:predicted phosphodiesterase